MTVGVGAHDPVAFFAGWGSKVSYELFHTNEGVLGDDAVGDSTFKIDTTPTSPPNGHGIDATMILDTADTVETSHRDALPGGSAAFIQSIGMAVFPLFNASIAGPPPNDPPAHLFGIDSGGLGGANVGVDANKKFVLCSQSTNEVFATSSTEVFDTGAAVWHWLSLHFNPQAQVATLYIHTYTGTPLEVVVMPAEILQAEIGGTANSSRMRFGQTAGASSLKAEIGNIYASAVTANPGTTNGRRSHAPLSPGVKSGTVTAQNGGNTGAFVEFDGVDTTDDETMLDGVAGSLDTSDYIKMVDAGVPSAAVQRYDLTNSIVGSGDNILSVGQITRCWGNHATLAFHQGGWSLGVSDEVSGQRTTGATSDWNYPVNNYNELDPANADWTIANVDSTLGYVQMRSIFSETRRSQYVFSVAYADNDYWTYLTLESGYKIATSASARRIFIT